MRRLAGNLAERTDAIEEICAAAHQRGMKVMLKHQLWLRAGFPGDIDVPHPSAWFAEYQQFLDYYAAAAARMHADILRIGTELVRMTGGRWGRMAGAVRGTARTLPGANRRWTW